MAASEDKLAGLPTSEAEEDLGPFYSTAGVTRRLGVSAEALDALLNNHALLALRGDNGSLLYPLFQFEQEEGGVKVLAGLGQVMTELAAAGAGPMLIAGWLTAPTAGLRGKTAIEHLRNGGSLGPVLALVASDADAWRESST